MRFKKHTFVVPTTETVKYLETAPEDDEGAQLLKKALNDADGKLVVLTCWHNHDYIYWVKFYEINGWAYPTNKFEYLCLT